MGHGTENDFVVLPDPDGTLWPGDLLDAASSAGSATAAPASGATASSASSAARTCPRPPPCWAATWTAANGSWTTATPTAPTPRCAATASASSCTCSSPRACSTGPPAPTASSSAPGEVRAPSAPRPTGATGWTWARPASSVRARPRSAGTPSPASAVSMGNPHLACLTDVDLDALDLTGMPAVDNGLFPEGVNVELVTCCGPAPTAHPVAGRGARRGRDPFLRHRCLRGGLRRPSRRPHRGTVVVDVPGGRLSVRVDERTTVLTGPAVLVPPARWPRSGWGAERGRVARGRRRRSAHSGIID